ncbi:MAG: pilus assembly protein [Moritella sp.]|uniref:TadE/TadG family type IV pilus assembly protein n=1 Tax=Moritella sp. TaxID=78556 RepID=UPI001E124A95|nr:TadE family protein [Moritella sp.]NQZ51361.1 pilus assembly protein [Moritella sp.]
MSVIKSQKGVFTIEFALGSILLFLSIFTVFELCRFIFIINLTESSLRESARDSRVYEGKRNNINYQTRFEQMFSQKGQIWHSIVDHKRYTLSINYYRDYRALVNNNGVSDCQDCPLAEYSLTYLYIPMLRLPGISERAIQRSILMVQEHQGWTENGQ